MSPLAVLSRTAGPPPCTGPWARRRPGDFSTFRPPATSRLPDDVLASSVKPCPAGITTWTSPEADDTFQSPVGLPSTPMLPLPVLALSRPTTPESVISPLPVEALTSPDPLSAATMLPDPVERLAAFRASLMLMLPDPVLASTAPPTFATVTSPEPLL